ncbi:MAG: hypothetical protein OEV81_05385 [Betaproteobacteria bacterium]|nr:hypothetical protein [Betaproteobacteria bacterium]MDH5221373.1 hypothetical protein [Betaproteobacteria bacterium]MDH5352748.1 hypothetical protein [Betaproteobacteria bacterium]
MGPLPGIAALGLALAVGTAGACDVPGDGTSLRRALLRVKYLPETELWELQARKTAIVQYVLSLHEPIEREGHCYWPIEARSDGTLWARFFATPNGEHVLVVAAGGKLVPLEEWRKSVR